MSTSCFTLSFLFCSFFSLAQDKEIKGPSLLYCSFFENDFRYDGLSYMNPGLSVSYYKGFKRKVDIGFLLKGSFTDVALRKQNTGDKKLLTEVQIDIRYRLNTTSIMQPFFTGGAGSAFYSSKRSLFLSPGAGLQANYKSIYFLFSVQYKQPFSSSFNGHVYYGIGVGGEILRRKTKKDIAVYPITIVERRDRDGDGIVDSLDACPEVPGTAAFAGCPDSDGDGIADKVDQCPLVRGLIKYKGCPPPDSDGDGLNDEEDKCVQIPGFIKYAGCPVPDVDNDGINDEEDLCIHTPGTKDNKGCPQIKKEITEILSKAAINVLFETGSAQLLSSSHPALDGVVSILNTNKDFQLLIEGHTDNVGNNNDNQLLSERRAVAVLTYFKEKGITKNRLKAVGHGAQNPIFSNQSQEGRAGNRRVVFTLHY